MENKIYTKIKDDIKYYINYKSKRNFFFVTDGNLLKRIHLENTYRFLEKEFAPIIQEGIIDKKESKKSDIVWICWFQGYDAAPDLVKACIHSVKTNMPDKKVILLDHSNIFDYISLPNYIIEKYRKKIIGAPQFSDLIRINLLCEYGGIWVDATVLCTSSAIPRSITDSPLFVFKEMELSPRGNQPTVASNWFISAESHQNILLLTRKLLYEYWKRDNLPYDYFVFHIFFAIASRRYADEFKKVPMYNNHSPHTLQFELGDEYSDERWQEITGFSCIHKLTHHLEFDPSVYTFYQHVIDEYKPKE